VVFFESDILRSILMSGDAGLRARLTEGTLDPLLEELRPHLVLACTPVDPDYLAAVEERGWTAHLLDPEPGRLEGKAAAIIDRALANWTAHGQT
jgi:hypothetical protein